jgi:hypothetical protein
VITGVNLPMLIKLADLGRRADLLTAAREMREEGRRRYGWPPICCAARRQARSRRW